ncbi:exocyst complex component EXO70B1-like protein [Tanacetum coccineum]
MVTHAFNIKNSMSMLVQKSQDHKKAKDHKMMIRDFVDDLKEFKITFMSTVISPAYRSFVGRYKAQFDGGKSIDKYIKYQPKDIESMIETLVEGTEKVETQLNGIQAVSTVKHTTGAFKSLLKSYKNCRAYRLFSFACGDWEEVWWQRAEKVVVGRRRYGGVMVVEEVE